MLIVMKYFMFCDHFMCCLPFCVCNARTIDCRVIAVVNAADAFITLPAIFGAFKCAINLQGIVHVVKNNHACTIFCCYC